MTPFAVHRAESVADAVAQLAATPHARIIAGGTNLVDLMKYDVERPDTLVDVTRVEDLRGIRETDEGLRIGALVSNSALADDERVAKRYPLLASALLAGATPQLRNAATVGGNLNQRTRCYYFYDTGTACNKREPGSGCPAREGVNRIHAVLGHSEHCIATHPSDMCVALAALKATVRVVGKDGERTIAFADYHRLPGDQPEKDNTLAPGEVVTEVVVPAEAAAFAEHHSYLKLRDRLSYAFALVSVAAALELDGRTIKRARVALGGVAHKPWRVPEAERALEGKTAGDEAFAAFADALLAGAEGFEHNSFKIPMTHEAIVRALGQAAAGTPQSNVHKKIV